MSKDPGVPPPSPRDHTNRSLRAERGDIDRMIQELAHVDPTADDAITRARVRAARLAAERRETDNDLSSERAESDDVLATRDEVLQIVSHDLRNLIGTILGMAGLIEEDGDPSEGDTGTVGRARWIMRAAGRMNRLVGDLTDAASIEAGTLALTCRSSDPAAIVNEAVGTFQDLAAEKNIALEADIHSPLPPGWFDPARIYQVLTNLLSNAIKFTPRGGKVVVRVDSVGEEIRFAVADTGIGIASELLTRVFTRNVQVAANDRRGAGLGLYISQSIVKRHGGRIWAESTPAEGTTFFFTVPLSEK